MSVYSRQAQLLIAVALRLEETQWPNEAVADTSSCVSDELGFSPSSDVFASDLTFGEMARDENAVVLGQHAERDPWSRSDYGGSDNDDIAFVLQSDPAGKRVADFNFIKGARDAREALASKKASQECKQKESECRSAIRPPAKPAYTRLLQKIQQAKPKGGVRKAEQSQTLSYMGQSPQAFYLKVQKYTTHD